MSARYALADIRAGYVDAGRTHKPRVLAGFRIGGLDYATGYALGVLASRVTR